MGDNYFNLHPHCIPVRGYKRSSICDLQREEIYYVPNEIADILMADDGLPLQLLFEKHSDHKDLLDEHIHYLIERGLGSITLNPVTSLNLDITSTEASYISNAIVDIDERHEVNFNVIFKALSLVGCRNLQLRFFRKSTVEELTEMMALLNPTLFKSIEIIVEYARPIKDSFFEYLTDKHPNIKSVFIHSSPTTRILRAFEGVMGNILFTEQLIKSNACCGIIDPFTFAVNAKTFTEAQQFNTCLNRKVGIDTNGDIKNCPSSTTVYGNIYRDNLETALRNHPAFEAMWHLKKDDFKACRDCEHRYVCIDCRVFLADPTDKLSKPLKCSYDPYSALWEHEDCADEMFGYDTIEPFYQTIAR
ncbi:grasp-with-spasm system SPASM domain peptide maturase [Mucilaginibacter dorajii]|uniref:Grasp-with-spasm system SPASM domain peptide maturase n=1 Tax=Mucilaginibacter dorajii TaxID=692994 RepID=A0ABP7PT60_9SPHI|nr:grasp-with-spasm system SPASM domain peptide maturase [Mucilaginibacter dorajii]MCS3735123.1 SPASM domain peptide maturase of grasp-with-spasm system [Mucilaginibacter dorajii]